MSKQNYFCNPLNIRYRYQFNKNPVLGGVDINREAADPSMIYFKGSYYIFASMTLDVLVSQDMVHWENKPLPDVLPLYGYAPDARVRGEYVYLCANESADICHFYRTKDILNGPYEKIEGTFHFDDPGLFIDEDDKMYFYWGLAANGPIYGVELDPETLHPIGEKQPLIYADPFMRGYERVGEDNLELPRTEAQVEECFLSVLKSKGIPDVSMVPTEMVGLMKDTLRNVPFIEGAWMNKFDGRYYLQYASPGTQFNTYGDGVFISDNPLGPFIPAKNNPYSYKPGGFFPGAGHGSTMEDAKGALWHASTMRISLNHQFERRIGIWPAGLDQDGELFCNQRYGDWPIRTVKMQEDPWEDPDWYLLSYAKAAKVSSSTPGHGAEHAVDENVRTWWQAAGDKAGEWLELDLGKSYDVHAIQINFADDKISMEHPENKLEEGKERYIETKKMYTRWRLEGSTDQQSYFVIEDKSTADTDLSHDFIVREEGIVLQYLRLIIIAVPYDQKPCISGLRVFGQGYGELPGKPDFQAVHINDLDFEVNIECENAVGYTILWGYTPEKLYHCCQTFEKQKRIGALVKGQEVFVRVDAFNESGITPGAIQKLESLEREA